MPKFENSIVAVVLPDGWRDDSDADVMAFANPAQGEELTISVGQFKERVDATRLSEIVWQLIQQKATALVHLSGDNVEILEVSRAPPGIPCKAEFSAFGSKSAFYARVVVSGHADHFISVSYYLRNCAAVSADTSERAHSVVGMCRDKAAS